MPSLVTGLALFGKIGVTASFSLIFLIAIEMYPTVTRCMGVAITVASASGGAMLSSAFTFLEQYHYTVPFVVYGAMMASIGVAGLIFPETIRRPLKNVQQCRHRKIPLMEGARLVGRPPNLWDAV
ncbi:solute carrier family 22 member 5 [Aplysia californica]|uniref:Solute carrier family 22 member 5 n=1 Tax=Aplysia californica TaxID=6500 RepID=A0ABM0ZWJ6_APLCA|nr:solute carrier family 22 member 5 [Aplysia californica]